MLFRYRARNYPESLTVDESKHWQTFCLARVNDRHARENYAAGLAEARGRGGDEVESLLDSLNAYVDSLGVEHN